VSRTRARPRPAERLRVVVAGYIVRGPLGGLVWHHLQYVLGLQRLGHEVMFLEDSGDDGWSCYDPSRGVTDGDCSYGLAWTADAFSRFGAGPAWAFHDAPASTWHGPAAEGAIAFCEDADILLNLSGTNVVRPWLQAIPVRVYVDTDPVFTQVRNLTDPAHRALAARHDRFRTFGENVGPSAAIPDDGFAWSATRQPVVLDLWKVSRPPRDAPFSTVMQWTSYPPVAYGGVTYGMKSESFAPLVDLPSRVEVPLELALGSADAPRESLRDAGWRIVDPLAVAREGEAFRRYVARSRAELAVAKHGYVVSRSGWFSERSANYLASGRPVVTQDTGFGAHLPVGEGLLAFRDADEAVDAISRVEADHPRHAHAARAIVEEHFDSDRVLTGLLDSL
jgi:hypothetical protein